jgi:hypothetical protein
MFELDNFVCWLEVGKRFDWRLAPQTSPVWPDNERISAALPGVGLSLHFRACAVWMGMAYLEELSNESSHHVLIAVAPRV